MSVNNMTRKIITAAMAAALVLTGCGKSEIEELSSQEQDKTLAAVLSERLDSGDYDLKFDISGGSLDSMSVEIRRFGEDGYVTMDRGGVFTEVVKVDKQTYMIMPEIHVYQLNDEFGAFGNAFIKLGAGDVLTSVTEEDGKTIEEYKSSGGSSGESDTFTFVFDTAKGAEGLEHITQETGSEVTEINVTQVSFSSEPITLRSLDGYDDITAGELVSEVAQVRLYMYYTFGLNEEDVAAMGYDYEQIARMKYEDQQDFYKQLEEQQKGSDSDE